MAANPNLLSAPTTYVNDVAALIGAFNESGASQPYLIRWASLKESKIWHAGEVVARFTGRIPVVMVPSPSGDTLLALQDNGRISAVSVYDNALTRVDVTDQPRAQSGYHTSKGICGSGWTGDRCVLDLDHTGAHSNDL